MSGPLTLIALVYDSARLQTMSTLI